MFQIGLIAAARSISTATSAVARTPAKTAATNGATAIAPGEDDVDSGLDVDAISTASRRSGAEQARPFAPARGPSQGPQQRATSYGLGHAATMIDRRMARAHGEPAELTTFAAEAAVKDGVHVVSLTGELDQATVPDLKATLDPVTEEAEALLIDLERCEFIDSTGLADAGRARSARVAERGGRFAICCAGPASSACSRSPAPPTASGSSEDRAAGIASLAA